MIPRKRDAKKLATTNVTNEIVDALAQMASANPIQTGNMSPWIQGRQIHLVQIKAAYKSIGGAYRGVVKTCAGSSALAIKSGTSFDTTYLLKDAAYSGHTAEGKETQRAVLVLNMAEAGSTGCCLSANDYVLAVDAGTSIDTIPFFFTVWLKGIFPVRLTQTGGSAGTSSVQCSFTYTVKDIGNTNTIKTGVAMTGNGMRIVNAAMTAGTYGLAYYDPTGTMKLIWADERVSQTNCT